MSPPVVLSHPFTFYGRPHHSLYVNNNGVVSFGVGVPEFTPHPFPLPGHRPFVAPYWADVDTRWGGDVFYRESRDPELLAQLARDLRPAVGPGDPVPQPTWAFVATWYRVAFFGTASKKVNTFQAVLATDDVMAFIMLNYGDIQWTTGISNGGDPHTGLGGIPAQVGFNSGDDTHYYNVLGSRTPAVLHVGRTSNVGVPGRWVFRVDEFTATEGPPPETAWDTQGTPRATDRTPGTTQTTARATEETSEEEPSYICG
ncbi:sushi, nidogen and EGF-like domain-containing protein 1 [Struthio camelus]|uniref:sushi, nidogen and EGF-like domain-containing protein 1 n=1 Tax=Struthio camelus TaxID=8801 RepID=UPI003603EDED